MKIAISFIMIITATAHARPALAHSPYYSSIGDLAVDSRKDVSLKILNGDGIFFADPKRAVVVDHDGNLLAASPMSMALTLVCPTIDRHRTCIVYDEISLSIYEPRPDLWRHAGSIEKDGRPIPYPEEMTEFGFTQRSATATEIAMAEFQGAVRSWLTTALSLAWWMLLWLFILPVGGRLFGRVRRLGLVSIVLRLLTAALMMLMTAYGYLLSPYSVVYLAVISVTGALLAQLTTNLRNRLHPAAASRL